MFHPCECACRGDVGTVIGSMSATLYHVAEALGTWARGCMRGVIDLLEAVLTTVDLSCGGDTSRRSLAGQLAAHSGEPSPVLQELTHLATKLFSVPAAIVTLVDGDVVSIRASAGLELRRVPRARMLCGLTVMGDEPFVVPDASRDPRFCKMTHLTEHGLRFYAGVPVVLNGSERVGTFAILDYRQRQLPLAQRQDLYSLAMLAAGEFQRKLLFRSLVRALKSNAPASSSARPSS